MDNNTRAHSLADGLSKLYARNMSTKRYVIKPAYHSRPNGRLKLYLIYDTDYPVFFDEQAMQPNWVVMDHGGPGCLVDFFESRGIDREDIRLDVARVLKDSEAARYLARAK